MTPISIENTFVVWQGLIPERPQQSTTTLPLLTCPSKNDEEGKSYVVSL
jgi:hypothetical protein